MCGHSSSLTAHPHLQRIGGFLRLMGALHPHPFPSPGFGEDPGEDK